MEGEGEGESGNGEVVENEIQMEMDSLQEEAPPLLLLSSSSLSLLTLGPSNLLSLWIAGCILSLMVHSLQSVFVVITKVRIKLGSPNLTALFSYHHLTKLALEGVVIHLLKIIHSQFHLLLPS